MNCEMEKTSMNTVAGFSATKEQMEEMEKRAEAEMKAMPRNLTIREADGGYIIESGHNWMAGARPRVATSIDEVVAFVAKELRRE